MEDIYNNKVMGLLIIAGGSLLQSQEHIKERRKQRKWARLRIRKRDSKRAVSFDRSYMVPASRIMNILESI